MSLMNPHAKVKRLLVGLICFYHIKCLAGETKAK